MADCPRLCQAGCEWCLDPPELRPVLARHYERVKRLAPMLSIGIQSTTLAAVLYGLVAWRGVGPWFPVVAVVGIVVLAAFGAWAYYEVFGMREYERRAQMALNPTDLERITPKEAALLELVLEVLAASGADAEAVRRAREEVRERRLEA